MQLEQACQGGLEAGAIHDGINKSMLAQVFGGLKAFGEFFAQGLLNHPPARKAD